MKIEVVVWGDAWQKPGDKKLSADIAKPLITHSVGFMVLENEEGVLLATDEWPSYPDRFYNLNFIPKGMILARYALPYPPQLAPTQADKSDMA